MMICRYNPHNRRRILRCTATFASISKNKLLNDSFEKHLDEQNQKMFFLISDLPVHPIPLLSVPGGAAWDSLRHGDRRLVAGMHLS